MSYSIRKTKCYATSQDRRGSALLIVLGFLSFMVVSAVSFAIYMRSERMPSSVFRRDVQARHLVKAGLARAISEIDDAIREDPMPIGMERGWAVRVGEGSASPSGNGLYKTVWMQEYERQTNARYYNRWLGRVFMPPNPDSESDWGLMAPSSQTTPVLNLEALGYLPPAVANDVRILSRGTWSAKWKNFDYGAGRYAYCAVDVSDFFDINRVSADTIRTSQDRISLAHLFAQDRSVDQGISSGDIGAFDDFVAQDRGNYSSLKEFPFVSMMDYNLALGARGNNVAQFSSPFYEWLGRSSSPADFYNPVNGGDPTSTALKWIRCKNSCFITDSWLPPSSSSYSFDVSRDGQEVFPLADILSQNCTLDQVESSPSAFSRFFVGNSYLFELDKYTLYDYLDRDDVPLSLCFPCTERAPMVAAIQPEVGFKLSVAADAPRTETETLKKHTITDYKINDAIVPQCELTCAIVFPFRHSGSLNRPFKAKAFVRVFLAAEGVTRRNLDFQTLRPKDSDMEWSETYEPFKLGDVDHVLAFTFVSSAYETITPPSPVDSEEDMLLNNGNDKKVVFRNFTLPTTIPTEPFFSKRETQRYTEEGAVDGAPTTTWKINYRPFKTDGKPIEVNPTDWIDEEKFNSIASMNFLPYVAVWVRIENSEGDVVDLVPAMPKDDALNLDNGIGNSGQNSLVAVAPNLNTMPSYLLFSAPSEQAYTVQSSLDGTAYDRASGPDAWSPGALYTFDPRFNFAAEDWYGANYASDIGDRWLGEVEAELGKEGRDADPFLFVSNQGYLQSLGELAFLPRLSSFKKNEDSVNENNCRLAQDAGYRSNFAENTYDGVLRTKATLANRACMWKSYRVFPVGDDGDMSKCGSDGLLRMADATDGGHGFRVSPYTTLTNGMFAALANTPYDWWAAGTNKVSQGGVNPQDASAKQNQLSSLANSLKYAFNESGGNDTRLEYKDLRKIATFLMRRFEEAAASGQSWEDMYDNLDWAGSGYSLGELYQSRFWPSGGWRRTPTLRYNADNGCSADPFRAQIEDTNDNELKGGTSGSFYDNLTSADRKYLYAFWRNCFVHRQQLFLVFVRAESTAMGGSGEGQIPAQQGGRAVALVWRDPATPKNQTNNPRDDFDNWVPHRTRVLFYHQFD